MPSSASYRDACLHAACKARIGALQPQKSDPLTIAQYDELRTTVSGSNALYMLTLEWTLAGRIGDIRMIKPGFVKFAPHVEASKTRDMNVMFVEGKGASCWRPWSIHTTTPAPLARQLESFVLLKQRQKAVNLFSAADQTILSKAVGKYPGCSLRSIRRGALTGLGVSDSSLRLLSGHQRESTVRRYLGWGEQSADAKRAAQERNDAIQGAGTENERPMAMGQLSGLRHPKGQRFSPPPQLFPDRAPSSRLLGIEEDEVEHLLSTYTLHAKEVDALDFRRLLSALKDPQLRNSAARALQFLLDPANLRHGTKADSGRIVHQRPGPGADPEGEDRPNARGNVHPLGSERVPRP
jgi:hypothetical protein